MGGAVRCGWTDERARDARRRVEGYLTLLAGAVAAGEAAQAAGHAFFVKGFLHCARAYDVLGAAECADYLGRVRAACRGEQAP